MQATERPDQTRLAKLVGFSMLAIIVVGILASVLVSYGIDINLNADPEVTAANMLEAESRVRGTAYIALLTFALEVLIGTGLFLLLAQHGRLMAGWSLLMSIAGALVVLSGAVFTMNVAELTSAATYQTLTDSSQRLMLAALQATSTYTSFHLALIISSVAKAGFFLLFLRSGLIPRLIAGWGMFASLFVAFTIIARDFVPPLANNAVTVAFMVSNLVALVATGLYLGIKGVSRITNYAALEQGNEFGESVGRGPETSPRIPRSTRVALS